MIHVSQPSDALPPDQRFDWWCAAVGGLVSPVHPTRGQPARFATRLEIVSPGGVQLGAFACSPLTLCRTPALIRSGDAEEYEWAPAPSTMHCPSYPSYLAQRRTHMACAGGEFAPRNSSSADACRAANRPARPGGVSRVLALRLPRAVLPLAERRVDRLLAWSLPAAGGGEGGLLGRSLRSVLSQAPELEPAQAHRLGVAVVELVRAFLAEQADADVARSSGAPGGAVLARIDAFIHENLADPELTPAAIAARHHISVRSLHALFRHRERTVAATIRHLRLERCRSALADPRWNGVPVHVIAARWGYTDAAVFSRAFRAAYGMPPSDYRRSAGATQPPARTSREPRAPRTPRTPFSPAPR